MTSDPQLRRSAQNFSQAMVRENFFAHVSPGGSTLLSRVRGGTGYLSGAGDFALGENIGWGCGDLATPRQTVRNWMKSPPHRVNMLNPRYRQVGVGVAIGAPLDDHGLPAATYTTDFGQRNPR